MRGRWTQRRAWTVLLIVSFAAWAAIGILFAILSTDEMSRMASDAKKDSATDIAPASGDSSK